MTLTQRILKHLCLALLAGPLATVATADIRVTDDDGNTIILQQPAQRIVSLVPHATELMFEIGAGHLVIGAAEYSDYPEAAKAIPRVGDYFALNLEAILSLQPDLVLAWHSSNVSSQLETLAQLNIPIYFTDPQNIAMIAETQRDLGSLTGRAAQGEQVAQKLLQAMTDLRSEYGDRERLRVFYQVWHDPIFTISNRNFIGELITLCGGENIFGDATMLAPQVGRESVVAGNPQVILGGGSDGTGFEIWHPSKEIAAVASGHLYSINSDHISRPTSSLITGGRLLCEAIDLAR
ncbi:cobalamin-binding protein [Salinispirillum sp. LH 10-3-1]|uniref:Cobalamin-binding protein n=1 Tax=Salinispirillum sp. LH 10-3-1 TaxID=2952525 RepID=A0AB38YI08_9GAMM